MLGLSWWATRPDPAAHLRAGEELRAEGRLAQAEARFRLARADGADPVLVARALVPMLAGDGRGEAARKLATELGWSPTPGALEPGPAAGWAEALEAAGQRHQALDWWRWLAERQDDGASWFRLGQALLAANRAGDAVEAWATAVRRQPDHAGAVRWLATLSMAQDRAQDLVLVYNYALRFTPGASGPLLEEIQLLNRLVDTSQQDFTDELEDARDLVERHPELPQARYLLLMARLLVEDPELEPDLRSFCERHPWHAAAHWLLGDLLSSQRRLDEVAAVHSAGLQGTPGHERLLTEQAYLPALARVEGGRESAAASFRRLLAEDPLRWEVHGRLVLVLLAMDRIEEAGVELGRLKDQDPEARRTNLDLGWQDLPEVTRGNLRSTSRLAHGPAVARAERALAFRLSRR